MSQLSEETANKLADAFIELQKSGERSSIIFRDLETTYRVAVKKSMLINLMVIIESYFKFNWKYPFNRLKMIVFEKKSLLKIDKLVKEFVEIDKLITY